MTLSATPAVDRYTADGSQAVFDYNFKILDSSHLQVFFDDAVQGAGFTVAGVNNDTGGTVTFDTAPTSGVIVTLIQQVPLDQPSALPNQGPFPSATVETQIADRIVMQNKQQQEELDRSVKVAVSSALTELDLTPAAGQFVAWNQTGDALIGADATPNTVPVSSFGATLVDDADASAALTTLGHSDYVKNNLIQSTSADAHLATLLPAIDTVLETIAGLVDVGVFHAGMDEHPEWYGGVSGDRGRFMLATAQTAGGNSTVKIWDMTVATPVVLQTISLTGSVVSAISDIKGGVIAIASEDGLYRRGWTKTGFGALADGLPDPITATTVPALTNNDLDDVCIGYSDQPAANPATGGKKPTIGGVYGTGVDVAFVLKDDGSLYDDAGTVGNVGCFIRDGMFVYPSDTADFFAAPISRITIDDVWRAQRFFSSTSTPHTFAVDNDVDAVGGLAAGGGASGLSLQTLTGNYSEGDAHLSAKINSTFTTGWMPTDIRGAWLANGTGIDDRSYKANTLTENGAVPDEPVATGAELTRYGPFSVANHFSISDAAIGTDQDAVAQNDPYAVMLWIDAISSAPGSDEYIFANRDDVALSNGVSLRVTSSGTVTAVYDTGSATVTATGTMNVADGLPHFILWGRPANTDLWELRIDGRLDRAQNGGNGDNPVTPNTTLRIGCCNDSVGAASDAFTSGKIALVRLSGSMPTAAEARHIYETERQLFAANAKCLLQGAANAVQAVAVDPVTADVHVGQADSLVRFEGLLMASERLATGETWTSDNHKALRAVDGALMLANAAESYASVPAIDLRDELAGLAGLDAPPGVDLSKAKAFYSGNIANPPVISASLNIKSATWNSAGNITVEYATPFKSGTRPVVVALSGQPNIDLQENPRVDRFRLLTQSTEGVPADTSALCVAVFGELDNE